MNKIRKAIEILNDTEADMEYTKEEIDNACLIAISSLEKQLGERDVDSKSNKVRNNTREYVCFYNEEYIMNHCIRTLANNLDEAYDKFKKYLEEALRSCFMEDKIYVVNINCIEEI